MKDGIFKRLFSILMVFVVTVGVINFNSRMIHADSIAPESDNITISSKAGSGITIAITSEDYKSWLKDLYDNPGEEYNDPLHYNPNVERNTIVLSDVSDNTKSFSMHNDADTKYFDLSQDEMSVTIPEEVILGMGIPSGTYNFSFTVNGYPTITIVKNSVSITTDGTYRSIPNDLTVKNNVNKGIVISTSDTNFIESLARDRNGSYPSFSKINIHSNIYDTVFYNYGSAAKITTNAAKTEAYISHDVLTDAEINSFSDVEYSVYCFGYNGGNSVKSGSLRIDSDTVRVTLNANGGKFFTENGEKETIEIIGYRDKGPATIDDTKTKIPFYDGYKFVGWYIGDKKVSYDDNLAYITVDDDCEVTARWEEITDCVTVHLITDGGHILDRNYGPSTLDYKIEKGKSLNDIKLYSPYKDGCDFIGWFTNQTYDAQCQFSRNTAINSEITLYAYHVNNNDLFYPSLSPNGGHFGSYSYDIGIQIINGKSMNYSIATNEYSDFVMPTRTGHSFTGWNTEADGSGSSYGMDSVIPSSVEKLYAQWQVSEGWDGTYTVTFSVNNSVWKTVEVQEGGKVERPEEDPIVDNWEFQYWELEGQSWEFDFANTVITTDSTLIASLRPLLVTVYFDACGGFTVHGGLVYHINNQMGYLPKISKNKPGCEFIGWFTLPTGGERINEEYKIGTESVTFYAHWLQREVRQVANKVEEVDINDADYVNKNKIATVSGNTSVDLSKATSSMEAIVTDALIEKSVSQEVMNEIGADSASDVKVVVETKLKIEVNNTTTEGDTIKKFQLNITPLRVVKAVTTDNTGSKEISEEGEFELNEAVDLTIYLPADSFTDGDKVWIKHNGIVFGGETGLTVEKDPNDENLRFVKYRHTGGFSPFEISKDELDPDDITTLHVASLYCDDKIGVNFKAYVPDDLISDDIKAVITNDSVQYAVTTADAPIDTKDNTRRVFTAYVPVKKLFDPFTIKFVDANDDPVPLITIGGQDITDGFEYNVLSSYVDYYINYEGSSAKLRELMTSIRNYVKGAQCFFEHNYDASDPFDNSYVEGISRETLEAYKATGGGATEGIMEDAVSLDLETEMTIRHKFKLTGSDLIDNYVFTVEGKGEIDPIQEGERYIIEIGGIVAKDLDNAFTLTVTRKNGTDENPYTITYSALSYVYTELGGTRSNEFKNMLKAMYKYNRAAEAYFGE